MSSNSFDYTLEVNEQPVDCCVEYEADGGDVSIALVTRYDTAETVEPSKEQEETLREEALMHDYDSRQRPYHGE